MRHGRRLFLLVLLVATAMTAVAAMPAFAAQQARPTNFKIYVNGRALSAAALSTAADTYVPVKAGRLSIGATWVTNLRGTGHKVIIVSSNGSDRRICAAGTSCLLIAKQPLVNAQESSWSVQIYRNGNLVSEKTVCLVGKK